ncbi:MAG: DUF1292 domain-containing protein [Firmicutes bacterium]|nr:DUF1292 domain-containing protein [Bacillota bacterium]MDD4262979.1 DUF1292 domain-containing protein [Bacillota bacterium]MDD4693839.1 DUF1292 domain-containing protein [Bacillota bacterium]
MTDKHEHDCCCGHDHDKMHNHDEDCDCGHDCDEDNVIFLIDEDGEEYPFEMIFVVEVDSKSYAVLGSLVEEETMVIMELVGEDEEELELHPIEDEEEFNRVMEFVNEQLEQEEDFEDQE